MVFLVFLGFYCCVCCAVGVSFVRLVVWTWLEYIFFIIIFKYSDFYVGSMYDGNAIRLHVARSFTSSPDSLWYHPLLWVCPTIFSRVFPSSFSLVLSFPSHSFLRSAPIFSSHAHTTSTSFPGISLRFPRLRFPLYSLISYLVQLRNSHTHCSICISATSNFFSS